ncbi:MAG: DHCW motif cupin fold protein [Proteobacteria bacterium]|nr:DHCW motif cupin fold protein [Pseudomonadota bacterium]
MEQDGAQDKERAFTVTGWGAVPKVAQRGETGTSFSRTRMAGHLRLRMVEYSPGYRADHWCARGHILLVLSGALRVELKGGKTRILRKGQSYHAADGASSHRSSTRRGARLFIVD